MIYSVSKIKVKTDILMSILFNIIEIYYNK